MRCETFELLLEEYIRGELTPHEETMIEDHLHSCPNCQELTREYRELTQDISQSLSSIPIPDSLQQVVESKIDNLYQKRPIMPWKHVLTIAASFLVIVIGVIQFTSFPDGSLGLGETPLVDIDLANGELRSVKNLTQTQDGITVEIQDVHADGSQLTISYKITADEKWHQQYGNNALIVPRHMQAQRSSTEVVTDTANNTLAGQEQQITYNNRNGDVIGQIVMDQGDLQDSFFLNIGLVVLLEDGADSKPLEPRFQFQIILSNP